MVPCGSNADGVVSTPNLLSNHVVPAWFNVVPTMRKCWHMFVWQILCSSSLTAGLLLDAGSALAKGGQVMFRPQPLHQLPKLPSYVLSQGAPCLEPPPLKILSHRKSCLSLARLPFTVCSSLPRPGLSLVIYIGSRALMELRISPQTCLQIVWFLCGSTWFQRCPNAGTCLFR